jgi:hypothetical protein
MEDTRDCYTNNGSDNSPTKENPMPHAIRHPQPAQTHHHSTFYILIAMAVMFAVIVALALLPSITVREPITVPLTYNQAFPDYAQRHPELILPMIAPAGATSDYYFRQINFTTRADTDDQTDYYFRHR